MPARNTLRLVLEYNPRQQPKLTIFRAIDFAHAHWQYIQDALNKDYFSLHIRKPSLRANKLTNCITLTVDIYTNMYSPTEIHNKIITALEAYYTGLPIPHECTVHTSYSIEVDNTHSFTTKNLNE